MHIPVTALRNQGCTHVRNNLKEGKGILGGLLYSYVYLHPQQNSPFSQRKFNPHNTQSVIFPAQGDEKMAI
jgi:hypothetical protein